MINSNNITLFLVDDDAVYLKSLEIEFLELGGFTVQTFATGELCLQSLQDKPDIVILDYHLNGINKDAMNGLQTLDKIKEVDPNILVIILSSQDKIDVAVKCMHHKASDYVVKSETAFTRLNHIIPLILHYKKVEKELQWYMARVNL
ncbi:MAG: response regulator [Crocinitomicaceae bacterium]